MPSLLSTFRDLVRLQEIYRVLVRHGFGELTTRLGLGGRRPDSPTEGEGLQATGEDAAQGEAEARRISSAERVRLVVQDLGPSFVKLAQIASTRGDLLPPDLLAELKRLQDAVPPVPFAEVRRAVEAELGRPLEEVYASFEEQPLAAASIGQVHRARLRAEGEPVEVVVKVQRPGVGPVIARDLELLRGLARLVERTIPEAHVYSPSAMVASLDRSITAELDFTLEAENAARFAKHFEGRGAVRFPRIHREASGKTVLTQEYLPGQRIEQALRAGYSARALTQVAVDAVVKMIFEDGFFHADPHPGNLLVLGSPEAPVLGFIDLGMVGRLSAELRDRTVDLMTAAIRQDAVAVADALYAIGTPTRKVDLRAYRAEVATRAEKFLGRPLREIQVSRLVADLVQGASLFGIEIPPDFLLVGKALMTLEGIGKEIDPDLDFYEVTRPFFFGMMRRRYAPERVMLEAWRGLERLSSVAYDVPQQLREVLEDLRLGRLAMKTTDPGLAAGLDRLGRRVFSGLAALSLVLGGSALLASRAEPPLGYALLGLGALVTLAHLARDWAR